MTPNPLPRPSDNVFCPNAAAALDLRVARHEDLVKSLTRYEGENPTAQYTEHLDAWANTQTGIGTSRDKITSTAFMGDGTLPFSLLEELIHNDDVSARISCMLPELALGQNFELQDVGLQQEMEALGAGEVFENAWVHSRGYGGAAAVVGMTSTNTAEPAAGDVLSLTVLDRWSLWVQKYYTSGPKFGKPELFTIGAPQIITAAADQMLSQGTVIHESRLIVFPGARTSPRKKYANNYWDDSVLQRCYKVIEGYGITWASVVHLLSDAAQGVLSIKDLWAMLLSDAGGVVLDRLKQIDEQRSSGRSMTLDLDNEKFGRVQTPFNSIPELMDRCSERLASAAETPLTILMGSSPAGMNATGQSDLEIWYGKGRKARTRVATPAIQQLARLMRPAAAAPHVIFPPFWLPTAKEVAESRYITAQADQVYYNMGTLHPEEVRASRFTKNGYSQETTLDPKMNAVDPREVAAAEATTAAAVAGGPVLTGTHHFSKKYGR